MKKLTIRKHSGLIKCWAEGYDIQVLTSKGWLDIVDPRWDDACEYRIKDAVDFAKHTRKEVLFLDDNLTTHIISTVDASDELVTYYEGWRRDYGLII